MQHAVGITFAVITIAGIIALLHLLYCMRKHIKEHQVTQAPSNLPVLHNWSNPCARGCAVCN